MHRMRKLSINRAAARLRLGIAGLLFACLAGGCGPESCGGPGTSTGGGKARPIGDTLTLTIVPYEAAEKLSDEYSPMAAYLAHRLRRNAGKFVPVVDYAGVLAALESGQVDVAYLSPLPYALATNRMKVQPLAMP